MTNDLSIYQQFIIKAIIRETADASSFEIASMDDKPLSYEAGQFITLVFTKANGKEDRRSYSFSSAPLLNEPARITIKRVENGEYSRQLLSRLKVGDTLMSSGISGFFRLPEQPGLFSRFVFLAAGSGITPVFSLLKTLLQVQAMPVLLIYSSTSAAHTIFYEELIRLREQYPHFNIEFLFSQAEQGKRRFGKFLLHTLLEEYKVPVKNTMFYLCGPVNYMLVASISLITAGVPEEHIRKENFNTRPHNFKPVPPDTEAHTVTAQLGNVSYGFTVQYPDTILAAAKKQRIPLPYSCEAGNCGSCVATCTNGKTWMGYNEVLMDDEIRQGKVLTCQAYPVEGDVELEF
jgi:ring-1,2-phenylacetyl-CoA epoxidase subunit PaaE